jgi:holo-[acyl-carrier protein] synthase
MTMSYSVGTDIVEIARINADITGGESRLRTIFTAREIEYCSGSARPEEHYAARFAGKEAIIKAFAPYGIRPGFRDIEITNHDSGYPVAVISHGKAAQYDISLSLSHSCTHAMAVALVMPRQGGI